MEKITVSDLVSRIKKNLETSFPRLLIEGEITNLSSSYSGHYYFTLSDARASISCALFKGHAARNPLIQSLQEGDKIVVSGGLGVYAKRGTFQIIVENLVKSGTGNLKEEFEKRKMRLATEGLFDSSKKRPLPKMPRKIAVITSLNGAALQDFINVFNRRSLFMNILVVPALVQGESAPEGLCKAFAQTILYARQVDPIDVIVLTRGGGSLEDLWAFNNEELARTIFHCPIPVISAVGHQIDEVISDFVADFRCETPTAAAECLSQYQTTLKMQMQHMNSFFKHSPHSLLKHIKQKLYRANPRFGIQHIKDSFYKYKQILQRCHLSRRMGALLPFNDLNLQLDEIAREMQMHMANILSNRKTKLESFNMLLTGLNPSSVLSRGFSYVTDSNGHVISSVKKFHKVKDGTTLSITFSDGQGEVQKTS